LVSATGTGTVTATAERNVASIASLGSPALRRSSLATRASVLALSSCCDTARRRASLSNGAVCPTNVVDTPDAINETVELERYSFGRNLTSAAPTTMDARMGTTSHHLRRRKTDR
jgi:hypothetical protein